MRPTAIELDFAGGRYWFDLPLKSVRMIEDKTGGGVCVALYRLQSDLWRVADYRETILWGLIGAGMAVPDATRLVTQWVDDMPARDSVLIAIAVIMAFVNGAPKAKPDAGKTKAAKAKTMTRVTGASTSPPSTVSGQP